MFDILKTLLVSGKRLASVCLLFLLASDLDGHLSLLGHFYLVIENAYMLLCKISC